MRSRAPARADRTGRYRCVLALARNGVVIAAAAGSVEGEILAVPRGSGRVWVRSVVFVAGRGADHGRGGSGGPATSSATGGGRWRRCWAGSTGGSRLRCRCRSVRRGSKSVRGSPGDEAETLAAVKETWTELHQWMAWAEDLRDFTPEQQAARTQLVQEEFERREQFEFVGG